MYPTMDHGYYPLHQISRLYGISIAEAVFGVLSIVPSLYNLFRVTSDDAGTVLTQLVCACLLLATGVYGIRTIHHTRRRILNLTAFRVLGGLNTFLCVLYSLCLGLLLLAAIMAAFLPALVSQMLAASIHLTLTSDDTATPSPHLHNQVHTAVALVTTALIVILVLAIVVVSGFVAMTAIGARIAWRNAEMIRQGQMAVAAGGVVGMVPPPVVTGSQYGMAPGYSSVPVDPPPSYTTVAASYPAFGVVAKQDLA
ncbi:uncharacterized protein LOC129599289 [Paramacrobiotus metropolitanus]|uniref:uncharacterized protein LOC129599289 n=1 Tax=Paramacrobiotus metropolitanus TaxID=2943436 RepID=UPI00244640F0|nr:uncharacterized protein LOC129599289 [Paramacrobiotus metropolitanus]